MKLFVSPLLLLSIAAIGADTLPTKFDPDVSKWLVIETPSKQPFHIYDAFMRCANAGRSEWTVINTDDGVRALLGDRVRVGPLSDWPPFIFTTKDGDRPEYPSYTHKVPDGWLIAYNRGEFGASLWWFSADGKERYQVSDHQVNQFFAFGDRILAVEGLAHLGMSKGSVIELIRDSKRWKASTFAELTGSGVAMADLPDGRLCIVTSDRLLAVSLEKKVEVLLPAPDWGGLYPSSIAIDKKSGIAYIGMRKFVARYNLKDTEHRFQYTVPSSEFFTPKAQ